MENLYNKVIMLYADYYQIIPSLSKDKRYVSLKKQGAKKVLRHQNSYLENRTINDDEQFKQDSSFLPVIYEGKISFFSTNPGIQDYCVCFENGVLKIEHIDKAKSLIYQFDISTTKEIKENNDYKGTKIYVAYHYDSSRERTNIIEPIHVGRELAKQQVKDALADIIGDNTGDNISQLNKSFCELTAHYWIWKNTKYSVVGLMHYRRIFNLNRNSKYPEFEYFNENILKEYGLTDEYLKEDMKADIIVPEIYNTHPAGFPKNIMSNYQFYSEEHYSEHYDLMKEIIENNYPQYIPALNYYTNNKQSFFFNMFIMKRKFFEEYSKFVFDVLFELNKKLNIKKLNDYQKRIYGFLSERLLNIYVCHLKFFSDANIIHMPVIQKMEVKQIDYKKCDINVNHMKYERKINDIIYIAFACDDKYIKHCYTAINSLKLNTKSKICIFVLGTDITINNQNFLKSLEENNRIKINFININENVLKGLPLNRAHISIATYYRLLLAKLIPVYIEKIIYLDCDILVLGDIAEFWETEISDKDFAVVVEDEGGATQSQRLGLPIKERYFNAGVMLFNLKILRKDNMLYKAIGIYRDNKEKIRLQDQDILNIYFCGNVKYQKLNWNVGTRLYFNNDLKFTYSDADWKDAILNPKIVHFTGNIKPWFIKCKHPLVDVYMQYQHPKFRKIKKRVIHKFFNTLTRPLLTKTVRGHYKRISLLGICVYERLDYPEIKIRKFPRTLVFTEKW